MTIALGGGGGRREEGAGEKGIIWFHLHLFTWTPWANGNHFHLKTRRGVKRLRQRNCGVMVPSSGGAGGGGGRANLSVDFAGSSVRNSHLQMELLSGAMFDMEIAWRWYSVCSALLSDLCCWLTEGEAFCPERGTFPRRAQAGSAPFRGLRAGQRTREAGGRCLPQPAHPLPVHEPVGARPEAAHGAAGRSRAGRSLPGSSAPRRRAGTPGSPRAARCGMVRGAACRRPAAGARGLRVPGWRCFAVNAHPLHYQRFRSRSINHQNVT